jgi:hypothetical protein
MIREKGHGDMSDSGSCTCSEVHTRAICDEVGDRLRFFLDRSATPPSPRIMALLLQLQLSEMKAPVTERPSLASAVA